MKNFIFLIGLFAITVSCAAQFAYYDALELSNYVVNGKFDPGKKNKIDSILAKYLVDEDATISSTFEINPFIKNFFPAELQRSSQSRIGSAVSYLGSLDVTNLADGIARFLIKRGKEELNVAFFSRMNEFLNNPKYPEAKTLFPVTAEFLQNVSSFRYAELLQSLHEAFYKDLSNILVNLNQLIDLPKYARLLRDLPGIRGAIRCAKIVNELSQSEKSILPDSLIHQLAEMPEWDEFNSNLSNSLKLLDIISQSVKEKPAAIVVGEEVQRRWIRLSDMNSLLKNQTALQIFIGLVYQRVSDNNIHFESERADSFMKRNVSTIFVLSNLVENFTVLANDVDRTIKDLNDKGLKGTLTNDDYYTYINKAINITEYGFKVANSIKEGVANDKFIIMARNANNLYRNIYTKNYNNAVMNAYLILQQFSDTLKIPDARFVNNVLKYGNFMASVAKAESGEDVQNALEAAALPAGSYSVKQKSVFNLSVNGYIGYAWDYNKPVFKNLYARGVYAPVGISASTGTTKKHGISFTGFLSLIDVGSIATYRLNNGTTENLKQEVRLESIFSPSAQMFFELGGYPFAVGGGWRKTPKLFYSSNSTFTVVQSKNVFNFSVLVDIPFFTILNHPFEKK